jgi:DNA-directed RNA polymerase specialized sigma24 family protein
MLAMASDRRQRAQIPQANYEPDDALGSTLNTMMRFVLTGRVESIEAVDGFWRLYRKILAWKVTERLINLLQPDLKSVVRMRLDGWTIAQMATALGVSPRSVDRMLDSIRRLWSSTGLLDGMPPRDRYSDEKS